MKPSFRNALLVIVALFLGLQNNTTLFAAGGANPPWYPSLMAFEHYDTQRTHLFEQATFNGSFDGQNTVGMRTVAESQPTPYNVVYLGADSLFVYGGGYGDKGGTGAFVSSIDPISLKTIWKNQLINTVATNEWDYPGVLSILEDGNLYLIYGYRIVKLDPKDGHILAGPVELPTPAEPGNTSYNGLNGFPDGTLVAKTVYREKGCTEQGFSAFLKCPHPLLVPHSIIVAIDPKTLQVIGSPAEVDQFSGGRITTTQYQGKNYIYLTGTSNLYRFVYENGQITLDSSWGPVEYVQRGSGQTGASAVVVMNDWVILGNNSTPADATGSSPWETILAVNQADATKQFSLQPFKAYQSPPNFPFSFAPSAVTVDPARNRIFTFDAGPGKIAVLELREDGLHTVWTENQRTTEFSALTGPVDHRVVIGTDIGDQSPGTNTWDQVVWRDAETGRELARSAQLSAVNTGTMVEPGYGGLMYYLPADGNIVELNAHSGTNTATLPATGGSNTSMAILWVAFPIGFLLSRGGLVGAATITPGKRGERQSVPSLTIWRVDQAGSAKHSGFQCVPISIMKMGVPLAWKRDSTPIFCCNIISRLGLGPCKMHFTHRL